MKLVTRNGWVLSDYATQTLVRQFKGTIEELVEYISLNEIKREDISFTGSEDGFFKPYKLHIGDYDLYIRKDKDDIIAYHY